MEWQSGFVDTSDSPALVRPGGIYLVRFYSFLLPVLKAKAAKGSPGRLGIVSSGTARGTQISKPEIVSVLAFLDDKSLPWKPIERYVVSKLLGHLFMINLSSYISDEDVIINLVDPGLV